MAAFEQLKSAIDPPVPAYDPNAMVYYTGDDKQVQDARLAGNLNDDELTALHSANL